MPEYRRAFVPGGTFFFTLVCDRRRPIFRDEKARQILGQCLRECQERWEFTIDAIVLLADHLHAIWTLPRNDAEFSKRWGWTKKEFSKRWLENGGRQTLISSARKAERRLGIWQPRFWEHTIDDLHDFDRHFDYLHFNPVKHGYVKCPSEWPHSSFHRWVKVGVYPPDWACGKSGHVLEFDDIVDSVGE